MNRPDDVTDGADLDLQRRLGSLLGDEPPMLSTPGDDLQRGRRLVRRRRWGAVGTAAVLVPALAVGAVAASNGLFAGASSTGPGRFVPAEGGDDSGSAVTSTGGGTDLCASTPDPSPAALPSGAEPGSLNPNLASSPMPIDQPGLVTCVSGDTSDGSAGSLCSAADKGCAVYPDDPQQDATMERLTHLLTDRLDADGTHTNGSSMGGASSGSVAACSGTADQGPQSLMVGTSWSEGSREGAVSVSVFSSGDPDLVGRCADQTMGGGPDVTCDDKTLADGTHIRIGHGVKDGAERLTVYYQRDDGQVVIATADQASTSWWDNRDGSAPLDAVPATVEQLTALATAPGAHL